MQGGCVIARIPLYQSKEQLTTESPFAKRSPQAEGQISRDLEVVGKTITEAHDMIRKAYDWQQVGTAKVKTIEGMTALEERALSDGDNTGDFSSYDSEMSRIKTDSLKGISNPSVKAKFELDFDLQAAQTKTKLTSIFRKNMVNKGLANLSTLNEYFMNEYATTGDKSFIDLKDKQIDSYVTQGFLAADDAQKLKMKTTDEAKFNKFLTDFRNNPTETAKNVDSYGMTIEQEEKARRVSKEAEKIVNENRAVNYSTAMEDALNGYLKDEDVNNLVNADKLNPGTGIKAKESITLKKAIVRGVTGAMSDLAKISGNAKTYMDAINFVFSDKPKEKIEAYQKILDIYSDGYTDKNETIFLKKLTDTSKNISQNTDASPMASFWKGIYKQFTGTTDKDIQEKIALQVQSVLTDIRNGKTIEQSTQRLSKEQISQYFPDYNTYDPKNGKLKVDSFGNKIRIFPDGTSKEE